MVDFVFKRYELKYLLTTKQYFTVKTQVAKRLCVDKFGVNTVQSLYYDTENYRLIRESLEKPIFKEKLRLRCYNLNDDDRDIYVEMKRKYDGIVYKRRLACKEGEVESIFGGRTENSQIGKELDYFLKFYGRLSPKMLILCKREAYFDAVGDLRVTFDRNIRYRTDNLNFRTSLDGNLILPADIVLMELKTGTAFPLWLCELLSEEGIKKQSFSKYGAAYEIEKIKNSRSEISCSNRFSAAERLPQSVSL